MRGRPTAASPWAPPALATPADRRSYSAHGARARGRARRCPSHGAGEVGDGAVRSTNSRPTPIEIPIPLECPASMELRGQATSRGAVGTCTALARAPYSRRPVMVLLGFSTAPSDSSILTTVSVKVFDADTARISSLKAGFTEWMGPPTTKTSRQSRWRRCDWTVELELLSIGGVAIRSFHELDADLRSKPCRMP